MLDHIRLSIPVRPLHAIEHGKGRFYFQGDLLKLGLNCAARVVRLDDNGKVKAYDLYAPYDKLGTDFSDMAIKFFDTGINCLPRLELKASPLKLLQGHNVYGFDCIEMGAMEMLGRLTDAFPDLCAFLDFENAEIMHLDCTFMAQLPSQDMVQPILDYIANISNKSARSRPNPYDNYVRLGGVGNKSSRYVTRKVYGKLNAVQAEIDDIQKKIVHSEQDTKRLHAMKSALPFADKKLRFEARVCKPYLTKYGYPTNLYQLIHYQRQHPSLIQDLWQKVFTPLFEAMQGKVMNFSDDKVRKILHAKLATLTRSGNISYTKADNLFNFYICLKQQGYKKMHKNALRTSSSKTLFYKNIRTLIDCGFAKSDLQNIHEQKEVIPVLKLINIDFNKQTPDGYELPVCQYLKVS